MNVHKGHGRGDCRRALLLLHMPGGGQADVDLEGVVDTPLQAGEGAYGEGEEGGRRECQGTGAPMGRREGVGTRPARSSLLPRKTSGRSPPSQDSSHKSSLAAGCCWLGRFFPLFPDRLGCRRAELRIPAAPQGRCSRLSLCL